MDNDKDEALKAGGEENILPESPADEQNLSETETEVEESTEEPTTETEVEDKKSASHRIKELNEEKKLAEERAVKAEEKAKSLEDTLAELGHKEPQGFNPTLPQVFESSEPEPLIKPGEESVDPFELERRLKAREDAQFRRTANLIELQNAKERNLDRIGKEAQESVRKYPELDPESDQFDKDLSDSVSEATQAYILANPTGSVKGFVDKLVKPYKRSIDKEVGEQRETIAKQASQGALHPTQVPKGERPFSALSTKEMEERLGGVHR